MDQTHLHLIVTHLPIYGSLLASFVLIFGIFRRSKTTKLAAYYLLVISAIGGVIAYSTGESAEESVEGIQGIAKNLIEEHEEFAKLTLISIITMGAMSLVGVFIALRKPMNAKWISLVVLAFALICFCMGAWTGYLGGQIRHTEVRSVNVLSNENE